jgi:hypothetical protein
MSAMRQFFNRHAPEQVALMLRLHDRTLDRGR